MKKKHKITLLVIGILLALSLMLSSSYALWVFNVSQESTNVLVSDCFEITFTDNNPIHLEYSFPMKDSDGVQTTPYEFKIKNICNHPADFQINLETLNTSTIDESFIKADLNGHINEYNLAESVEPTIEGAKSAAMLYEDTLEVNEQKTYNLRIWVNENATQEDVENKIYSSKVSVKSTVRKKYDIAMLKTGIDFDIALKSIAGDSNPTIYTVNTSITSIQRSLNSPSESDSAVLVSNSTSANKVYAWFNEGIIYIYSDADKIYMNADSRFMFMGFKNAISIDLSYFDTSKVTNMQSMFYADRGLTSLDVSNFDTSNVTSMFNMFMSLSNITDLDVSHFNTSKVTNMSNMFYSMSKLTSLDVSNFDTSNVTDMNGMFCGTSTLTSLDVSNFNTSKVTNMTKMFSGMSKLTSLDISNFDTSNVITMLAMFNNMYELTNLNVSHLNTSKVTSMSNTFAGVRSLTNLDLSDFDTSNVLNMYGMFSGMSKLTSLDVSNFDTSKVTDMSYMFANMSTLTSIDISNFDTSKVTNMSYMFHGMSKLKNIYTGTNWNTSSIASSGYMFTNDANLIGGAGTTYDANHIDVEYARVDDPDNGKPGYFTLKTN